MTVWFLGSARAARAQGGRDPNDGLYNLDGGSGFVGSIVAVPFFIATAPIGLALMASAWACTLGGLALVGGLAALIVLALLTVWSTAEIP